MTELWSGNDEKTQRPRGMDSDYKQTTAHRSNVVSQIDMQDRSLYNYRPQYDSTCLESGPHDNLNARSTSSIALGCLRTYPTRLKKFVYPCPDQHAHPLDLGRSGPI